MTDMDDAMAQDNLMMLKDSDQAQDLQLQLADQIENMVGNPRHQHIGAGFVASDYGGSRGRPRSRARRSCRRCWPPCCGKKRHASHTTTPSANAMPPTQDNCKRT